MKIELYKIKLFANHGWYEEERLKGHWFEVSVKVSVPDPVHLSDDLKNTLNYELLYAIVLKKMATPQLLLETVVQQILDDVKAYPQVQKASVRLYKLAPFKMEQTKKVGVELKFKR